MTIFFKKKLKLHGVSGNNYCWFGIYLSNQKQCVAIDNNENTSSQDIIWRVPQGSVFGLPLFKFAYY